MLTTNTELQTILDAAPTKASWSNLLSDALGANRTLHLLNNNVEFFSSDIVGELTQSGGNISSLGYTENTDTRLATDLLTGESVLRIEGNGNWIQGSLGLTRAAQTAAGVASGSLVDYDFTLSANPTTTTGIAFGSSIKIFAPEFLPSGTGPAAPDLTSESIVAFRLVDWTDPLAPVTVGTANFDTREPDMVMDRPWMASEYGDIRIQRCADGSGIVFGTGGECFKFSGCVYHMNAANNSEANVPVQQVEIRAKPHGRWANFPFRGGLNTATDTLIPPPHKIELLRADGTIADIIEMYAYRDDNNTPGTGKAVNDETLTYKDRYGKVEPPWTCHMVHAWWSHRPKLFSKRNHLIPGVDAESMHPTNVTQFASSVDCWPMITGSQTINGLNTWRLAPKWSRNQNRGFDTTIIDPYFAYSQAIRDNYITQRLGYGFQPGSQGTMVWFNGPGGSRADRACWPTAVVTYMTEPDGIRPHGAIPYKDMFHHWCMNYFNYANFYFSDVEKGFSMPKSKVLNGEISYIDWYYGTQGQSFRPNPDENCIRLFSAINGSSSGLVDNKGRRFNNEFSRDNQHNQNTAAVGAYTYISPMHVKAAEHSFIASVLAYFDATQGFSATNFMTRQQAWYIWQLINIWIVSNSSSFTSSEIENMFQRHLEQCHDVVMPRYLNDQTYYGKMLRNLGMWGKVINTTSTRTTLETGTDSKAGYIGCGLLLWKQSGLWDIMKAKSAKCSAIMDLMITCYSKQTVDVFIDCNGRLDRQKQAATFSFDTTSPPDITNWGVYCPVNGELDWIRGPEGDSTLQSGEAIDFTGTKHFRAQTLKVLYDYFPEYNIPRIQQGMDVMLGFYKTVEDGRKNGSSRQFSYRFPMMGLMKKAAIIGPPA